MSDDDYPGVLLEAGEWAEQQAAAARAGAGSAAIPFAFGRAVAGAAALTVLAWSGPCWGSGA